MSSKNVKILIVDDIEDNRFIIKKICRKLDGIELFEASNGLEAVEFCRENTPDIILMDIMMPVMDGFEASTIIKSEYPECRIVVVTALTDDDTEKNFLKLGIDGYLRKPLARGILKVKLEGLIALIQLKYGSSQILNEKSVVNPFCKNIRKMKTLFSIDNQEDMINMGLWLTEYYSKRNAVTTMNFDFSLDLIYQFTKHQIKSGASTNIVVEEDFDNVYVSMLTSNIENFGNTGLIVEDKIRTNVIANNGVLYIKIKMKYDYQPEALIVENLLKDAFANMDFADDGINVESPSNLDINSYDDKITASEFLSSLDMDTIALVDNLGKAQERFAALLDELNKTKSIDTLQKIAEEIAPSYIAVTNKIYDFSTIAYGLSLLSVFIKLGNKEQLEGNLTRIHSILLSLYQDLTNWRDEIFVEKSAVDIHKFDNSILNSCIQLDNSIKLSSDDNE